METGMQLVETFAAALWRQGSVSPKMDLEMGQPSLLMGGGMVTTVRLLSALWRSCLRRQQIRLTSAQ
jgi:hypothetical protein